MKIRLNRYTVRKLWLTLHLYLGLFIGAAFILVSLTGSILVFYQAIDEWLNPDQLVTSDPGTFQSVDVIVAAAKTAHPELRGPDRLIFPLDDHGVFEAWFKTPAGVPDEFDWTLVAVEPQTGRVLSDRRWGGYLVSFIYELHKSMLLGGTGEAIVGILAMLLIVSVGTGLYLWWPNPGKLRRALSFKPATSVILRQYGLHTLSGICSAGILFILAFSGIYLEFPEYVTPLVKLFSPVRELPKANELRSTKTSRANPISVAQAVTEAQQLFPDATVKNILLPADHGGVYRIVMRQPGEVRRRTGGQSVVWLDQYSGAVLKVRDWREFTLGETFIAWLYPLHNGEAFGLPGRWVVFMTGFAPLILYITALRMWWLKRRAHVRQRLSPHRHDHLF